MLLVAVPFCIIAVTITPIESAANGLTKINLIVSAALMAWLAINVNPIDKKLSESKNIYRSKSAIRNFTVVNKQYCIICFLDICFDSFTFEIVSTVDKHFSSDWVISKEEALIWQLFGACIVSILVRLFLYNSSP